MIIKNSKVSLPTSSLKPGFEDPKKTEITRTFEAPVTHTEHLGNMPSDTYEHNWFGYGNPYTRTESHSCYGGKCTAGPVNVYRDVPDYNNDGTPKMKTLTETLTAETYNQKTRAFSLAGIGAAIGVAGSAIGSAILGAPALAPLAMGISAVLGAAGGFALGHKTAAGDSIKEVWETHSISHPTMNGYTETVRPDTYYEQRNCRTDNNGQTKCDQELKVRGAWHEFSPDISWRQVGTYDRPTLQHTNSIGPIGSGAITVGGAALLGIGVRTLLGAF